MSTTLNLNNSNYNITSSSGTIWSMASNGYISMPWTCIFSYYLATSVTNATGAGSIYSLGTGTSLTKIIDQNNNMASNGIFTAPVTGNYFFSVIFETTNFSNQMNAASITIVTPTKTYEGGSSQATHAATDTVDFQLTIITPMSTNETAQFNLMVNGGSNNTLTINGKSSPYVTYVMGYLIC